MSWEYVVMASAVASAGAQYAAASTQAKAGAKTARIKAQIDSTNASLASLEATQTERSRLKQFAALQSSNISSTSYDPYSSKSFLAIENDSEDELKSDVDSIRLLGQIKTDRYAKQAKISDITGDSYRAMGKTAWLKPAGTLMAGGYKAHKVTKEG
ncbi:MAG: hypothetical protein CMD09_01400 [Flavobacteriales bacterium]|nr:hypothetical protein [Flavobacteriales bacterium]OUW96977.1 MAG: hypothetical protein CBD88_03075 [Flavobacteriales bacterium TMED228]|tara:strand:+ start:1660 stop:2127 length:468 start_codon:yes stop_codon:yes gene_type:complete